MKTKITLLITLFIGLLANAQPFYTFSKLTATYTDLVSPISINNNKPWQKHNVNNGLYWDYTLPFNFNINGVNYKLGEKTNCTNNTKTTTRATKKIGCLLLFSYIYR